VSRTAEASPLRWLVLAVFVLSSAINYLDRMALATLAPVVRAEFRLSNADYGWIVAAFSIAYAVSAPFAGILTDRIGLNRAISLVVGVWSCAGIATGFTRGLGGLVACRTVLGVAEAGGIPAAGKAIHQFLLPAERGLGNAANQMAVSLGLVLAPPIATWIAVTRGWRETFVATGVLGLAWIAIWNATARCAPVAPPPKPEMSGTAGMLRDRRLWAFAGANALSMVGYSLWTNWTTVYLMEAHGLTLVEAAWYAWIPPLFAAAGGLAGGWLSLRLINRGMPALPARFRACLAAAVVSLVTVAIPLAPSAGWACAGISLSILAVAAFSVNTYTLPLDAFGGSRAAFGISILVASYGIAQFLISPAIGWMMDQRSYAAVAALGAVTPLAACAVLRVTGATR
jgi:ACS family hexuronate transporter-like MFS transporter